MDVVASRQSTETFTTVLLEDHAEAHSWVLILRLSLTTIREVVYLSHFRSGLVGTFIGLSCKLSPERFFHPHALPGVRYSSSWHAIHSTFGDRITLEKEKKA